MSWIPNAECSDAYDRDWRSKGYTRHEIVGTRIVAGHREVLVGCSKFGNMISLPDDDSISEVFCPECERAGELAPMLARYQQRTKPFLRKKKPAWKNRSR